MITRPMVRAIAWLAFLGPLFFLTYNLANYWASLQTNVPELHFAWERHIPFLAWTILPYWSSDLLYGLSLLLFRQPAQLDRHGQRLVAIQLFSTACFLAFPLRFSFERPAVHGWEADLFGALLSFDRPFNQAPSLHVSLALIIWTRFRANVRGFWRPVLAAWFPLMALSTLTTYQHHFIDIPTGVWAGLLVIAALPEQRRAAPQVKLTLAYLAVSAALTAGAFVLRGWGWLLLWPAFALSMVAAAYWTGNPQWLAKRKGRIAFWMWPYTAAAWINSRLWTRGQPARQEIADGIWIGRAPAPHERQRFRALVDLTAELPVRGDSWVPMLDLALPGDEQLDAAALAIENSPRPALVCCALGYSRSAAAAAAWLIASGRAASVDDALARVRQARPQVAVSARLTARLRHWAEQRAEQRQRP